MEESRAIYGCLKNGWYGLRSLIWTRVVMALLRSKRPEQIKHHGHLRAYWHRIGKNRISRLKRVLRAETDYWVHHAQGQYEMLGPTFSNCASEGRGIIKSLLSATGDLCVQGDVVEVHLEQLSAPRYTQAMQSLCQQLTALSPRLPETDYRLRFFVEHRPIGE